MAEPGLESVTAKAGGMPIWAWGVALGGAAYLFSAYKKKKTAAATPTSGAPVMGPFGLPASPTGQDMSVGNLSGDSAGNYSLSYVPAPLVTPSGAPDSVPVGAVPVSSYKPPAYTDNGTWAQAGVSDLVGKGYNPTLSQQALADFISGSLNVNPENPAAVGPQDPEEQSLVNVAITDIGPPPQTVLQNNTTPAAVAPQTAGMVAANPNPQGLIPIWTADNHGIMQPTGQVPAGTALPVNGAPVQAYYGEAWNPATNALWPGVPLGTFIPTNGGYVSQVNTAPATPTPGNPGATPVVLKSVPVSSAQGSNG